MGYLRGTTHNTDFIVVNINLNAKVFIDKLFELVFDDIKLIERIRT